MAEWLSNWGALAIALVALAQPWIRALYRRYLRPGLVRVYETGHIEVSYGGLGAGVVLVGTLLAEDKDVFVRRLTLRIVRQKDRAQREFEWNALRSLQIPVGGVHAELEMPAGFMLLRSDPRRYNAFFVDSALSEEVVSVVEPAARAWNESWQEKGLDLAVQTPGGTPLEEYQELLQKVYQKAQLEFSSSAPFGEASRELDRLCYWDSGEYSLELQVETPSKTFTSRWIFRLTDTDARSLRNNVNTALRQSLGWDSPVPLSTALCKYLSSQHAARDG